MLKNKQNIKEKVLKAPQTEEKNVYARNSRKRKEKMSGK